MYFDYTLSPSQIPPRSSPTPLHVFDLYPSFKNRKKATTKNSKN